MQKKRNVNWNRYILDVLAEPPIAFIPSLAHKAGSATAGLFLAQLLYWCGKGYKGEWTYKTIEEMEQETCLNRGEQARAIAVWEKLGVLEKKVMGVPPRRHFRLHILRIVELVCPTNHSDEPDVSNCSNEQNTITENTSENTVRYPVGINCPQPAAHVDRI